MRNLRIRFKGFNKTIVKVTQKSFRQSAWCVETMDITKSSLERICQVFIVCLSLSVFIFVSVTKQHNYWLLMADVTTEKYQRTFLFLVKICCCFFAAFFLSLSIWSNLKYLAEFDYSAIASSINKGAYWHLYMSMPPLPQTSDVVIKFILISSLQRFFFLDQLRLLDFYSGKIWPSFSWMQTGCIYSAYCKTLTFMCLYP